MLFRTIKIEIIDRNICQNVYTQLKVSDAAVRIPLFMSNTFTLMLDT